MKVLYITCIPSPYKVEFLSKLGEQCDLTVVYERKTASDREKDWKTSVSERHNKEIFLKGINYSNDASISLELINHLRHNSYDIIVFGVYHTITTMLTMQYLHMKHIPFVLSSDGGFKKNDRGFKRWLKKHFIGMASWYLSPGGMTNEYLVDYGAEESKIFPYPFTSIDIKDVLEKPIPHDDLLELRKKLGIYEEKIILFVGQMIPRKGLDVLLNAVPDIDCNIGVYIAGGKETEEYSNIISQHKLKNIHFIGFKNKEELGEYYRAADVFVLPTREDIWGLVVIEALAYGTPVISTNRCNSGIELIRDGKNGYIVNADSPAELANAVNKVLEEDRIKMSIECLSSAKKNTYDYMVQAHMYLFNKITR